MPTVIEAQLRAPGGKNANRRLRKSGRIPAVMYGQGKEPVVVSVNPAQLNAILHSETGRNTIFDPSAPCLLGGRHFAQDLPHPPPGSNPPLP